MSYQVFARKYRPQTFKEVIGQEHVTNTLANAIAKGRLAHAFLFVGPRGTGKTSTARILAKSLNCHAGPTIDPCGNCDACTEIARGNCLDVLEIDGASNNGIEQVRELRENARFAPARDRYKIYIIDEVHMLSTSAFNALLKTLEEPPPHVKFIFATTEVHKVLPTILSRCQRFDLRRIPAPLIAGHLEKIARLEGITLMPEAALAIARTAEGGLRDAESMLDQLAAFGGDNIGEEDVMSIFGLTPLREVADLCSAILNQDAPGALALLHRHDGMGRDLAKLLDELIHHLRALLVTIINPEGETHFDTATQEILSGQASMVSSARVMDLIEIFAAAENRMRWAPNKLLHFEVAVIRAIQSLGQTTLDELLSAAAQGTGAAEAPTQFARSSKPAPAATSASAPLESEVARVPEKKELPAATASSDATAIWRQVCEVTRGARPLFAQWMQSGEALRIVDDTLVVGFSPESKTAKESLSRPNVIGFLKKTVTEAAGRPLELKLEIDPQVAVKTQELDGNEKSGDDYLNDPLIADAVQRFNAKRMEI